MRFLIAAAAAAFSTTASAADLVQPSVTQPAPAIVQPFSWTGTYIGALASYGWAFGKVPDDLFDDSNTETIRGGGAGLFGGYNHQFRNNVVVGLEGTVNYNWNEHTFVIASPFPVLNGQSVRIGTDWQGSVEGKFGYSWNRALVFVKGGWAATHVEGSFSLTGGQYDQTMNGWTTGLGVDYAFTQKVFGRFSASYSDFGKTDLLNQALGSARFDEAKLSQTQVFAGVGIKF